MRIRVDAVARWLFAADAAMFRFGCHGIPTRCLVVRGRRMCTCSRCFGAAIGQTSAFVAFAIGVRISAIACLALLVVMLGDWAAQQYLHVESTNRRRLATGFGAGAGLAQLYCYGALWLVHAIAARCW